MTNDIEQLDRYLRKHGSTRLVHLVNEVKPEDLNPYELVTVTMEALGLVIVDGYVDEPLITPTAPARKGPADRFVYKSELDAVIRYLQVHGPSPIRAMHTARAVTWSLRSRFGLNTIVLDVMAARGLVVIDSYPDEPIVSLP